MTRPHPVGDPLTAYWRVLARARRSESRVRELREEIKKLRAQNGTQQHEEEQ